MSLGIIRSSSFALRKAHKKYGNAIRRHGSVVWVCGACLTSMPKNWNFFSKIEAQLKAGRKIIKAIRLYMYFFQKCLRKKNIQLKQLFQSTYFNLFNIYFYHFFYYSFFYVIKFLLKLSNKCFFVWCATLLEFMYNAPNCRQHLFMILKCLDYGH